MTSNKTIKPNYISIYIFQSIYEFIHAIYIKYVYVFDTHYIEIHLRSPKKKSPTWHVVQSLFFPALFYNKPHTNIYII